MSFCTFGFHIFNIKQNSQKHLINKLFKKLKKIFTHTYL